MSKVSRLDRREFRLYLRDPSTGLLVCDGLLYRGEKCVLREVRKVRRVLAVDAEARPL